MIDDKPPPGEAEGGVYNLTEDAMLRLRNMFEGARKRKRLRSPKATAARKKKRKAAKRARKVARRNRKR